MKESESLKNRIAKLREKRDEFEKLMLQQQPFGAGYNYHLRRKRSVENKISLLLNQMQNKAG